MRFSWIAVLGIPFISFSCEVPTNWTEASLQSRIDATFDVAEGRMLSVVARLEREGGAGFTALYPVATRATPPDVGRWVLRPADDWRSGFFPGVLLELYGHSGNTTLREAAIAWTEGLAMAWELAGKPASGPFRQLYDHAIAHANTILAEHVRPNGSTYHVVQYEETPGANAGRVHKKLTDQGCAAESTWSRGQAWSIYGFTRTYHYTKDDNPVKSRRFLHAAKRVADWAIGPRGLEQVRYGARARRRWSQ